MAGFQWGAALGAGAKSALSTYETLEDIDQQRADSARRDRALQIQEDANTRAQQSHARQERSAARAEADSERLRAIYAGGQSSESSQLPDGTGAAGAETSRQMQEQPRAAISSPGAEGAQTAQPPRQEVQPTQDAQPRGRRSMQALQDELVQGGFLKEAQQVGVLRNLEMERQLTSVRTKGEMTKLKGAEIDLAQRQLGQHIARAGQIVEQLPGDDNVPLMTAPDSPARAVIDQMADGYDLLPDGRKMNVTYNDDGSASVEFIDRNTGEVSGGQKITTQGQLRQFVRMSSAFSDPVTYNQYITRAETNRRERELHDLNVADKRATGALNAEKARGAQAERIHLERFNKLLQDPAKNEDELRYLADVLGTYNPKLLDTRKVVDPSTGAETSVQYNKLTERIDAMVPLEQVSVAGPKGEATQLTAQEAAQSYSKVLEKGLAQTGGNPNMVMSQLRAKHDKQFRRGSFDRYVRPILEPQLRALMQQAQQGQEAAKAGASEPFFKPGSVLDQAFGGDAAKQRWAQEAMKRDQAQRTSGIEAGGR